MLTKRDQDTLGKLARDKERLAKHSADTRAAELKADFESQMATKYDFDDDAVWKAAHAVADEAAEQADQVVKARCAELGIPKSFAPSLSLQWYNRGENAVKERRTELRKVAYTRIEALQKAAKEKITLKCCEYRIQLAGGSLESDEAKALLTAMPTISDLMPVLEFNRLEQQFDKARDARRNLSY